MMNMNYRAKNFFKKREREGTKRQENLTRPVVPLYKKNHSVQDIPLKILKLFHVTSIKSLRKTTGIPISID